MSYTVKNLTGNKVAVGKLTVAANGESVVDFIDEAIMRGVNAGVLSIVGISSTTMAGANATLTDNSGGTASTTIAAIADVPTKNAIASLAAVVNQLATQMNNSNALVSSIDERVNQ